MCACSLLSCRIKKRDSKEVSTYFPAADSEEESQDIRLLLLLKLFDVLEGTHLDCLQERAGVRYNIDQDGCDESKLTYQVGN